MIFVVVRVLALACRGHHELAFEHLALRQQLNAVRRGVSFARTPSARRGLIFAR